MRLRIAALGAALLPAVLAVPAQAAPASPAVVRVTGLAGTVVRVPFPRGAVLSNGGGDTALSAAGAEWAGVAIVRAGRPEPRPPLYYRLELGESLLCPGARCAPHPAFQPTGGVGDDGRGKIRLPGATYSVVLLGPERANITVTIRLNAGGTGTRALRASERVREYAGKAFTPVPGGGAARGFIGVEATRQKFALDLMVVAATTQVAGSFDYHTCATRGGSTAYDTTPGGIAPCGDFSGADYIGQGAVPPQPSTGGMLTAIGWYTGTGWIYPESRLGVGFEAHGSGVNFRVVGLGVVLAI